MKEIKQIIQAYKAAAEQGRKAVLATVVHIEGSAYRAPGARMLITDDGRLTGAVSGGCLEGDVLRKALTVMIEERPMLVTYDTSDDGNDIIGVSLGCNGIIRILLEPVPFTGKQTPVTLLQIATELRQPAIVVTFFNTAERKHAEQGTRMTFSGDNYFICGPGIPVSELQIAGDIYQVMSRKASAFVEYPKAKGQEGFAAFIEYVSPVPALVIAGAGNDIQPLAQMAAVLGWDITLIDGRISHASEDRFPGCRIMISRPEEAVQKIAVDERTAFLLMSHNYHYDKAILSAAIHTATPYIGILGPKKKAQRLLQELEEEGRGLRLDQQERIFGPTGFDIGAETAEEIALSILAEVKAVFEQRPGASLRKQAGLIHQRRTGFIQSMQTYGVLLLAAGASKRMGTAKQALIYNGDTLLRNAVQAALELRCGTTVVVVSDEAGETARQLDQLPVDIAVNEKAQEGMGGSIREGIKHMTARYPELSHVLIMVCDQPFVDAAHLRALIGMQQSTAAPVVASYYDNRKGVPALFHRSLFTSLQSLEGDTGAKHLIEMLGDVVAAVDFPQGSIDVDTKEAFQQIIGSSN
jgi:xanthine/CO dehydrogenase XdhC/CoxF family maturation factor/CTP:molybdopterin cytidylyltransferase MocA